MATKPINPAVPNMPLAPIDYEPTYQEKLTNVLRLFFNQINTALGILIDAYITNNSVTTVAKLPTASPAYTGVRTFVSDSTTTTFGATVTGGGSNTVPVYCTGTGWKVG
jgi:hypothetical protein